MKTTFSLLAAAAIALLPVTAAAQSRQDQQLAASQLMIQEQQQQTALALAQLTDIVKALNPRFDVVIDAINKRLANLELTIKQQGDDINAIREQTQESRTRLGSVEDEVKQLQRTMADLLQAIAKIQIPAPVPVDPNAPPVSQGGAPLTSPPTQTIQLPANAGLSPQRQLDLAKVDYSNGQFSLAVSGFESVIRTFPGTQAAAEAQFWIGESYSNDGKWPEAVAAYNLVIQNHGRTEWVDDAYYKRGIAHSRLGQSDEARASFEFAAKNYPDTEAGRMSQQRLLAQPRK